MCLLVLSPPAGGGVQNLNSSTDYTGKVSFFKCSAAYGQLTRFLTTLNTKVQGKTLRELRGDAPAAPGTQYGMRKIQVFASDAESAAKGEESKQDAPAAAASAAPAATTSAGILTLQWLLDEIDALIAQCPPTDKKGLTPTPAAADSFSSVTVAVPPSAAAAAASSSSSAGSAIPLSSRFGSGAFRTFLNLLESRADSLVEQVLVRVESASSSGEKSPRRVEELFDPDQEQSAQSKQWEQDGFETLRKFKADNAKGAGAHDHAHHHHQAHKLPPGVVISHGPSGVGNPPPPPAAAACSATGEHDHDHEHEHSAPATAVPAAAAAAVDTSPAGKRARIIYHLTRYLLQSWGDIRRLDYGTGHEMNFMCFLLAMSQCGVFRYEDDQDAQRLIGIVFAQYVQLMRKLQTTYWLEPAGSRGVWGLDDYSFLPFLFGSAQLMGHKHIKPKSVTRRETHASII